MSEALGLEGVAKSYNPGTPAAVEVLADASLSLAAGEVAALVAPSGAGKSTLLHVAGLLDAADAGEVRVLGRSTPADDAGRTRLRRDAIGFVYQFHHLLPEFSALENVALPQRAAGADRAAAEGRARELLGAVGLAGRLGHRPAELSGGEQQRVAFARALANRPGLLLADEPTGNLDPETAGRVFEVLLALVRETGLAALIATHNPELAGRMDRVLRLEGGRIVEEVTAAAPGGYGAARSRRSRVSRKRARSAGRKGRPPPGRNGSAALRSAIRSRIARRVPMLAAVKAVPSGWSARPPRSRQRAASGRSAVTQTSPAAMRSAIHLSAASAPSLTTTTCTRGCALGRRPPLVTKRTSARCRSATRTTSARTGQASAST